jgi:hypothetical protein
MTDTGPPPPTPPRHDAGPTVDPPAPPPDVPAEPPVHELDDEPESADG